MNTPFKLHYFSQRFWLIIVAIVVLSGFGFVVARSGPLAPIKVTVAEVIEADLAPTLFGIGTVEARRSYQIGPTAAGRVQSVAVDVGELVKAGQLLAEMDPIDLDQRAAAGGAALARASSAIAAAAAQRRDAQVRRELSGANARRYVELGEKAFVTRSVVDGKLQEEQSAIAQLNAAEATLSGARQDQARLRSEHAGLLQQRAKIRLVAPVDGIITARDAEPGSTLVAGQSAVRMIDPGSLWIKLRLDQSRSSGLQPGLSAKITLRSQPGIEISGKVARVELIADSITEERLAQVSFERIPDTLAIGEMAEVTLQLPAIKKARVIPSAALRYQGDIAGVWKLVDGALQFTPVKLSASSSDGKIQVNEALSVGDSIVVHSEKELKSDSRIKVVTALTGSGK
ncbi:efflux RND transporter periplasmic adaptor subunit [Propionivibrio sp.]|uniref:efflux RND transporter periplasmic adaptor subunit n=1 Tax=Propionivibrio sp. TaxID=2212460 RepID=UPI003BF226EE